MAELLTIIKAQPGSCPTCGRRARYDEEEHKIVWICGHLEPQAPENYNYKWIKKR